MSIQKRRQQQNNVRDDVVASHRSRAYVVCIFEILVTQPQPQQSVTFTTRLCSALLPPPLPLSLGIYILSLPLFQCCFGLFISFHFVFLLLFLFYASEFAVFISHRTHLRRATIIGSLLGGSRQLSLSLTRSLFSHFCSISPFHTLALAASASFPHLPFHCLSKWADFLLFWSLFCYT